MTNLLDFMEIRISWTPNLIIDEVTLDVSFLLSTVDSLGKRQKPASWAVLNAVGGCFSKSTHAKTRKLRCCEP